MTTRGVRVVVQPAAMPGTRWPTADAYYQACVAAPLSRGARRPVWACTVTASVGRVVDTLRDDTLRDGERVRLAWQHVQSACRAVRVAR